MIVTVRRQERPQFRWNRLINQRCQGKRYMTEYSQLIDVMVCNRRV